MGALYRVSGKSANYFVAGRSLPLWIMVATLGSQSLDANAALGNLDLGYFYHWFGKNPRGAYTRAMPLVAHTRATRRPRPILESDH